MVFGRSLTPEERSGDAKWAAIVDGAMSAMMTGLASASAVWYSQKNIPSFRKLTNFQSKTALVIMPPLFAFGFASESTLLTFQRRMAEDAIAVKDDSVKSSALEDSKKLRQYNAVETEKQLAEIYKRDFKKKGKHNDFRIVKGDSLSPHHIFANYFQENPFKMLFGLGMPSVAYIFNKYNKKQIPLQLKLMQTRVVGQASVIIFLLSLVGFKTYMDNAGKYITEGEAFRQIEEAERVQQEVRASIRIARQNEVLKQELIKAEIEKAKKTLQRHDDS